MAQRPLVRRPGDRRRIYSVSQLNREVRLMLESGLSVIWVEGEISNLARPASGHWYLTLKDDNAQIRGAMFRQRNRLLGFRPENGTAVTARGRVSLYEPRGDYQFIIDHMEPAGAGALQARFDALKRKLAAEGLFDADRKRGLPTLPKRIGVITSPSGAAIRDVLQVLARRCPGIPVRIYPVAVQGAEAASQIVGALELAAKRADCDVLLLTRGGGSLEDLWSFNEESVARAIAACPIPVVAAVGHETDFTIADFVADLRAPTPSAAAELIAPDRSDWLRRLAGLGQRLDRTPARLLGARRDRVEWLARRLQQLSPAYLLRQRAQRLDELEQRLSRSIRLSMASGRSTAADLSRRLSAAGPRRHLPDMIARTRTLSQRKDSALRALLERARHRLDLATGTLRATGPQATLERGYAIVSNARGDIVHDAGMLKAGDKIHARLARGSAEAAVVSVEKADEFSS